ncbi:hypothetical protein [Coxiella-like endosymbiont]|uniref:hypothetical protein n=1 Tax=Coxiella-like endosymbiont TaxID=1592897 RepID=UPI00272AF908|nr:hypothetical protein [Coxiella-like endosymbiont]
MFVSLTKKNEIMIFDFALEAKGNKIYLRKEAIIQVCLIHFRPIIMKLHWLDLVATIPIALGLGARGGR